MRRRNEETQSYLGDYCNQNNEGVLSGKCGDGFYCNSYTCTPSPKVECKNYASGKCTECFVVSTEGKWNNIGNDLRCDLDYIDMTKFKINYQKPIEVPPAIHWRVTMDFWILISDTPTLSQARINMHIVYKDFLALTLRCEGDDLKIYATPLEWLYEYPTYEESSKTA